MIKIWNCKMSSYLDDGGLLDSLEEKDIVTTFKKKYVGYDQPDTKIYQSTYVK